MVTRKQIREFYEDRHRTEGEAAWRPFEWYRRFTDHLSVDKGKLLDVGCGTGHLLKAMKTRGLECHGIDFSKEAVKIAKSNTKSEILVGDGENLPYKDNYFDYVTLIGTLEHLKDINRGISEIVRVSKKSAIFCIVVPNLHYFFWLPKNKMGTAQREISEHLFTLDGWKSLLENNNLFIHNIFQDKYFSKKKIFARASPVSAAKNIISRLIWSIMPLSLTYQFIFVCSKRGLNI